MKPVVDNIKILNPVNQLSLFGYEKYFVDFINTYKKKKLPNIILLSGQKGSGKATFAYHFINYLLSENEKNAYSTSNFKINSENSSFKLLLNNIHPNFYIIKNTEKSENIKIEQIRNCIKFLNKSNYSKDFRIVLIDDAENLNINSSNALLKSLEEPSKNTFFFLIYNDSKHIIETIKTRCLNYKIHFTIEEKIKIFNNMINDYQLNYVPKEFSRFFFYDTPGSLLNFISLSKNNLDFFYNNDLASILYLLNEYKKNYDNSLLNIISTSIENFYNLLCINNIKNFNYYFLNKNKITYIIYNMKKFNLDKKNLIISIEEILENERK